MGAPENSILSHETAYAMGARGIEFDIRATKDKVFVVFHDEDVKNKTNGRGKIQDKTLAEVKALRLKHNGLVTDHQIPTLRQALRNVRGRYMVDIDFKGGFENSAQALKSILREEGFEEAGAPLVTIFCRNRDTCAGLMALNDHYAVRPLYLNKNHAKEMKDLDIRVMGLRNHQFTLKRARRIRGHDMQLFKNTMKYNALNLLRELLGLPLKRKRPALNKLNKYFQNGLEGGALFIQTDYLPELVSYLKDQGRYQEAVLDKNFQAIIPPAQNIGIA